MSKKFICKSCGKSFEWKMMSGEYNVCHDCKGLELIRRIFDLEAKLAEHNEYFRSFSCENFNEFQDFISTFMLTPHEEQTLIRELKQQLAEKEKEIEELKDYIGCKGCIDLIAKTHQDKISFAVDILEELADCSNYINSKLDFECGSYVSEKVIRDKIKYLKGKKDE